MINQIKVKAFGSAEELVIENIMELPRPGPGQILVDVEAAGVNYMDVYQRKGIYKASLPIVLGLEGVGRISALGEGTQSNAVALKIGQRIAWINAPGSYASQVLVPASQAIPVPDSFSIAEALLFQALTAQYLVKEYRDIKPGDRVLVHSAAGGVGQLLIQWFKHLGAWVVGTTSSNTKAIVAQAAGADAVVQYGPGYEFLEEVLALTNGQGVHLAIDGVGEATLRSTLKALSRGGTAVSIGSASGPAPAIEPSLLTNKAIRLAGGSVFSYTADPVELQWRASEVIKGIQEGWLRISGGTGYDLAHCADAHRDLESRNTQGKLYLIP